MPRARLIPAVPVPFRPDDGALDEPGLNPIFASLDAAGVDGVFVSGTTGEFIALDDDERDTVLDAALAVFGPDRVYTHVGAAAARQAERLVTRAVARGAKNLAAITPYYVSAGPAALLDHFRLLSDAAGDARLFVYLYPANTTTSVDAQQLAELAGIPAVAGAKISGLRVAEVTEYLRAAPAGFEVYSGNDIEFGAVVRAGAAGGVCGVASAFPEPFVALRDALIAEDDAAATAAQARIEQAVGAVGGNAAFIKTALSLRGLPAGPTRVALDPPSPERLDKIKAAVADLG